MSRPAVTLVVPFAGPPGELGEVGRRFTEVARRDDDEILVVDNSPHRFPPQDVDGVRVIEAKTISSPGYARNAGAALASGQWLVFCDADTEPTADLLDAYFDPPPGERTAILAGGIEELPGHDSLATRLARATAASGQRRTLSNPYMPFAATPNCAFRLEAFREVGGFEEEVFAGEDADLSWRLQRAGWTLEERPAALVHHRNRERMGDLWRQRVRHGAGSDWLRRRYPGAMPRWGLAALVRDSALRLHTGLRARMRGERGALALEAAVVSGWWAFELGRRTSNRARPDAIARLVRR